MDDIVRRSFHCLKGIGVAVLAMALVGCSLAVMAGKMIMGDPVMTCAFTQATGIDLTEGDQTVLVVCTTPESIKADAPSLHYDLLDGVTRRLERREVKIVNPDQVADWLDSNGGYWNDINELAESFEAEYIIHIELDDFSWREENSPTLLRGRTNGHVNAYQIAEQDGVPGAYQVFTREYVSSFPEHNPISRDQRSERIFLKQYVDRVAGEIAWMFFDHRLNDEIQ